MFVGVVDVSRRMWEDGVGWMERIWVGVWMDVYGWNFWVVGLYA